MYNLENRLNKLEDKIKQPNFRQNKGLGNEVGYYVFDYLAEQEILVRKRIDYLASKYEINQGFKLVVFGRYSLDVDGLAYAGGNFSVKSEEWSEECNAAYVEVDGKLYPNSTFQTPNSKLQTVFPRCR